MQLVVHHHIPIILQIGSSAGLTLPRGPQARLYDLLCGQGRMSHCHIPFSSHSHLPQHVMLDTTQHSQRPTIGRYSSSERGCSWKRQVSLELSVLPLSHSQHSTRLMAQRFKLVGPGV